MANKLSLNDNIILKGPLYLNKDIPLQSAGNQTLDFSLSSVYRKTGGDATITLSNIGEGQTISIILESIGACYLINWVATGYINNSVFWSDSKFLASSSDSNKLDFYTFTNIGNTLFGKVTYFTLL